MPVQVFGAVWDTTLQEKRSSLSRLFGTWTGVLPAPVLARVQERMVSTSRSAAQQQQQPPKATQLQPAPAPQVLPVQQQQPIVQLPPAQLAYTLPGQLPGQQLHVLQQQPQILGPQQFMGLHQQPTFVQVGPNLLPVLPPLQQQILQPIPLQHAQLQQPLVPVQHNTPQHIMQALPPVSPAHPGWAAQQQQPAAAVAGPGPMLRRSPGSPAVPSQLDVMRGPPPPAAGRSSAGQQQQVRKSGSPMPTSGQLTSDALSQLLSNLAGTGVLAKGGGGAAEDASKVQKVKDFQPAFLKVLWAVLEAAVAAAAIKAAVKAAGVWCGSMLQCQRGSKAKGRVGRAAAHPAFLVISACLTGNCFEHCAFLQAPSCMHCLSFKHDIYHWHVHACTVPFTLSLHAVQLTLWVGGWVGRQGRRDSVS
jgi:hypothetical protein